jgi:hypothetical protein
MSSVVRYEFMGNWIIFWLACISVVGLPIALLYLITGTIRVETEMQDPEAFAAAYRSGKARAR